MKIAAIQAYNANVSTNHNSKNNSVHTNTTNNSPSFTSFIIDDISKLISQRKAIIRAEHRKAITDFLNNDIRILSKRLGKSEEEVTQNYGKELEIGGNPRYQTNRVGLDSLIGYPLQKMKLIKEAVVPIIKKVTGMPSETKVPNGVIISGNGIENEKAADSLLEHLKRHDPKREVKITSFKSEYEPMIHDSIAEGNWKEGDTEQNIEALCKPFERARVDSKRFGSHSAVFVKNIDDIFASDNTDMLQLALKYQTEHASKDGVTWVVTTQNPDKLPKWLTKKQNPVSVEIGDIKSEFDKSLALKDSIIQTFRDDKTNPEEIFAYMRLRKIPERPSTIDEIVQSADQQLKKSDFRSYTFGDFDYSITDEVLKREIDKYAKNNI